jgi:hypothetical protein
MSRSAIKTSFAATPDGVGIESEYDSLGVLARETERNAGGAAEARSATRSAEKAQQSRGAMGRSSDVISPVIDQREWPA